MNHISIRLKNYLLLILWIIVVIVGLFELGFMYYLIFKPGSERNLPVMTGYCNGRHVKAMFINTDDASKGFILSVDDKIVYMELDKNNDKKPESIIHLENGLESYVTVYTTNNQPYIRKAGYYDEQRRRIMTVYDSSMNGNYFQRIRYMQDGTIVREKYNNNQWVEQPSDVLENSKLEKREEIEMKNGL